MLKCSQSRLTQSTIALAVYLHTYIIVSLPTFKRPICNTYYLHGSLDWFVEHLHRLHFLGHLQEWNLYALSEEH